MLQIRDEISPLTDLCVCRSTAVPSFDGFRNDHEEFEKFPMLPWDRTKLVEQQERFYEVMEKYGVRLHFVQHSVAHPWQMYTRDTGFVIHDKLYFSRKRELPKRSGEIELLRRSVHALNDQNMVEIIAGQIEGGDVLVDDDIVFVGIGSRTTLEAVTELAQHVEVTPLHLGPNVMHLDTRMTILPGRRLLIYPDAFRPDDLEMLQRRFTMIEVVEAEALAMGTNVFVIDPETLVVHSGFARIAQAIEAEGLNVELIDYSEPNALLGSFRCATMPLARS